jgi:TonB family protein
MFAMSVPVMAKDNAAITPPQIITLAPVSLSPELREKYSEKTILVKLRATISESGTTVGDIKIITSSGDEFFDQAAIDSLKQSVFRPAYASDYQAVACTIVLPLNVNVEKYLPEEPASSTADPLPEQP